MLVSDTYVADDTMNKIWGSEMGFSWESSLYRKRDPPPRISQACLVVVTLMHLLCCWDRRHPFLVLKTANNDPGPFHTELHFLPGRLQVQDQSWLVASFWGLFPVFTEDHFVSLVFPQSSLVYANVLNSSAVVWILMSPCVRGLVFTLVLLEGGRHL